MKKLKDRCKGCKKSVAIDTLVAKGRKDLKTRGKYCIFCRQQMNYKRRHP